MIILIKKNYALITSYVVIFLFGFFKKTKNGIFLQKNCQKKKKEKEEKEKKKKKKTT
jgi:hypothetical protein